MKIGLETRPYPIKEDTDMKKTHMELTQKKESLYRDVRREGLLIKATEVTSTYTIRNEVYDGTCVVKKQVSKWVSDEEERMVEYPLREISKEEIPGLWKAKVPSFLLKKDGKFYHGEIPKEMTFLSSNVIDVPHQCAGGQQGVCCARLEASPDPKGCAKVRARSVHIERYAWITYGYETFGTNHTSFVVGACEHYKKCPPKKQLPAAEVNRRRLALASFFFDDVESMNDVRRKIASRRH